MFVVSCMFLLFLSRQGRSLLGSSCRDAAIDYSQDLMLPAGAVTLIASKSKTRFLDMWVYLGVFGVVQWAFFILLLVAAIAAFGAACFTRNMNSEGTFSGHIVSGIAMAYMFTLQMGTYQNIDSPASKMIQLTASMLTLVMFAYYTQG